MDKTFQNQQLVGTEYIKDSYNKINENFTEIDTDLDSINTDMNSFSNELTQIINETDLDPNKDPEVTNARTSEIYGSFPTLKERLDYAENAGYKSKIYGVEIDDNNSNPYTRVTYIKNAEAFTPCAGNNGNFSYGSWEEIIKNEFKIRPCVLNNPAKTVNYYLDTEDFTKKEDETPSVLDGTDGDVMIEFGTPIFYNWEIVNYKQRIQISTQYFPGATKIAFDIEDGYNQFTYYPLLLNQILFVILFKSTDSQSALGRGYVDGNTVYADTGNTNTLGFMYGSSDGTKQMKFLGMEDFWGNKVQWIDGLVSDANYNLLIGNENFNDNGNNYTVFNSGISVDTAGYIKQVQGGNDKGFIIKDKTGSSSTYYADYGYLYASRVAYFGGSLSNGSSAGVAFVRLSVSSAVADATIGARLFCKNANKIYIGAYLGTTVSAKLRSISGVQPTGSKTIGAFRTEARANNN